VNEDVKINGSAVIKFRCSDIVLSIKDDHGILCVWLMPRNFCHQP